MPLEFKEHVRTNLQGSFLQCARSSKNVFVPRPCTEAAKQAFSYRGAVMWNGPENVLKDEINLNSFKSALSLPLTGVCREGVVIELILVI